MTLAPLFEQLVRVRLNAPSSRYHEATGTVDAHEVERARGKDKALTLHLDAGGSTIAFADELEPIAAHPQGGCTDNRERRSP